MTISMIRGYTNPPNEGGPAYQQYSQYGYTYITQEGEGHSEPDNGSFEPIPRMDAYRGPRLATPGALGYGCNCAPMTPMGRYYADAGGSGATGPGYEDPHLPPPAKFSIGMLLGVGFLAWMATR